MIGDTSEEMMAFYLGLYIGILLGLHFVLGVALYYRKKYHHLLNIDKNLVDYFLK